MKKLLAFLLVLLLPNICFAAITSIGEVVSSSTWYEVSSTTARTLFLALGDQPGGGETTGVDGGVFSYSGGLFDTSRNQLFIIGGGHNAYYGNETYMLDIDDLSSGLSIDWGPDPIYNGSNPIPNPDENPWAGTAGSSCNSADVPNSRHTGSQLIYVPTVDEFYIGGYSTAPTSSCDQSPWTYDPTVDPSSTCPWTRLSSVGTGLCNEQFYVWDSENSKVYTFQKSVGVIEINQASSYARTTKISDSNDTALYSFAAVDPGTTTGNHWLIWVQADTDNTTTFYHVDLDVLTTISTATIQGDLNATSRGIRGGLIWYPPRNKFLWFNGAYNTGSGWTQADLEVYEIDHTTTPWTTTRLTDADGDLPTSLARGPYGRFAYDSSNNVLVVAPGWSESVYLMRLEATRTISGAVTISNGSCQ